MLGRFLWPDRDQKFRDDFCDEKEALFRKYAGAVFLSCAAAPMRSHPLDLPGTAQMLSLPGC